jgi:hypothetical protein
VGNFAVQVNLSDVPYKNFLNAPKLTYTIGLQTKRLSVAQRKRFIRERKMREWTWTVKRNLQEKLLHLRIRVRWGLVEV